MLCFKSCDVSSAVVQTLSFSMSRVKKSRGLDQGYEETISQQRSANLQRTIVKKPL